MWLHLLKEPRIVSLDQPDAQGTNLVDVFGAPHGNTAWRPRLLADSVSERICRLMATAVHVFGDCTHFVFVVGLIEYEDWMAIRFPLES